MAVRYLDSFVGVKDGTKNPPDKQDGRKVGAKQSTIQGMKVTGVQWDIGDTIFAGTLRQGELMLAARVCTGTSLGTATLSLGTLAAPTKYVNAATLTTTDRPTVLGPSAAALALGPVSADEDLYWTVGVAAIVAGTVLSSELTISSVK